MVVSPAIGGIVIGHEVGRALRVPALFAERDAASKEMTLRRGFEVKPGDRAVVVEDVITTGGSTKEVIRLLQGLGVRSRCSRIDHRPERQHRRCGRPAGRTRNLHPETYNPDDCPLCRQGLPVTKPGSRPT